MVEHQAVTIQLVFVSANEQQPDPATVAAVARQTIGVLRAQGYTVQPVPTDAKGSSLYTIITELGQNVVNAKEWLLALIGLTTPILHFLLSQYEKRSNKDGTSDVSQQPPQINLTINQISVQITPDNVSDDEWLMRQLLEVEPALVNTITSENRIQIEVQVPHKAQRQRR